MKNDKSKKLIYFDEVFKKNINLNKIFEVSDNLAKFTIVKRCFYSYISAFYIGIAFLIFYLSKNLLGLQVGTIVGSITFPFAFFASSYMGGNLFTGNNWTLMSAMRKKMKWSSFIIHLFITWFFNLLGSLTMLGIARLIIDNNVNLKVIAISTAVTKLNMSWYATLASGFICNILMISCIYVFAVVESAFVKFTYVFIIIFAFAISGFQHSIANQFAIGLGVSYFDDPIAMQAYHDSPVYGTSFNQSQSWGWGAFFLYNEPLVALSNTLSGLFIPFIYVLAEAKIRHKTTNK